ncbi:MAG: NifU family protein [Waddliaceae bacterium]
MGFDALTSPFPWSCYSSKLIAKIERPHNVGFFTQEESKERKVRLAIGNGGELQEGNCVRFFWLVDQEDGIIVDARFQVLGQSALIGAADAACDLLAGKNYDQAGRMTAALLDKQLQDRSGKPAFPPEAIPHLSIIEIAIKEAAEQCMDIPLSIHYVAPPAPKEIGEVLEGGYPGWEDLEMQKKLAVIERVLDEEVRPFIALDGGGIELLNLVNEKEVLISYQGNCTSCYSAVGATLSYIQQMIQAKVHPALVVVPQLDH